MPNVTHLRFLLIVLALSLFSPLSWYVSNVMPDLFSGLFVLAGLLLILAKDRLNDVEYLFTCLVFCVAITVHTSHVLVIVLLSMALPLMPSLRRRWMCFRLPVTIWMVCVVVSIVTIVSVNSSLHGRPSLTSPAAPPFLLARIVADGPGERYLRKHCPDLSFAVCAYLDVLPGSELKFLWKPDGVMKQASPEDRARIRQEEMTIVLNTVRAYPFLQLQASMRNFIWQFFDFHRLSGFGSNETIERGARKDYPKYFESRQYQGRLHQVTVGRIHLLGVIVGLFGCAYSLASRCGEQSDRFRYMCVITIFALSANAAVMGILSGPFPRYQGRMIWIVPLLALLAVGRGRRHLNVQ